MVSGEHAMGNSAGVDDVTSGPTVVAERPASPHDAAHRNGRGELKETWPLHKRQVRDLLLSGVALTALFTLIGWLLTNPLKDSALVRADQTVTERLVDRRTPTWNTLSWWGSMLAETAPKIVVTAIIAIVFVRRWKRWLEAVLMCVAL